MRILNTYYEDVPPSNVLTPEEIEQICCEVVPVDECSEVGKVTPYEGADQSDIDKDAALEQARADNPGKRILGVQIEDIGRPGKPCGEQHETWHGRLNCCDGVPPLSFDLDATPDILPHGESIIIYAEGGIPPFTFRTTSLATSFPDGRRTWATMYPVAQLMAGPTFCGGTQVEVTDGCSTAVTSVRSDLGRWQYAGTGCPLPASPGTFIKESFKGREIEAIVGATKVIDFQIAMNSEQMGTYWGAFLSSVGPPGGCPVFNGYSCEGQVYNHCDCADAAGIPNFARPVCLAFNYFNLLDAWPPPNPVFQYACAEGEWMNIAGAISFSCNDGHYSGSVAGWKKYWIGGGDPPEIYKWVC